MKIFRCQNCKNPLYFENIKCEVCGCILGYHEHHVRLETLLRKMDSYTLLKDDGRQYRFCKNAQHKACNWIIDIDQNDDFCTACSLNRTIPNLSKKKNLTKWRKIERAKHRLIYGLLRFKLPVLDKDEAPEKGLAFDFLSDTSETGRRSQIRTGHLNGLITINIAEADIVHREYMRKQMAERYRTLIGHFRHEVGHYYWERLVRDRPEVLKAFREKFGDERADYGEALKRHYKNGPPKKWRKNYITKYAASHPWEDWAETWAHYLHLIDMLETAFHFGMETGAEFHKNSPLKMQADFDPYVEKDFDAILDAFIPLTFALNSLNRSMGHQDIYPFVMPKPVVKKLKFVHKLLCRLRT